MQGREPCATCGSVSVGGNKRRFLYLLYYIQPAIARTSSSAGFLDFFFSPFDKNNGMQKKKKKSFGKGAGQISSNCLVIGKWFSFLTIFLAG